MIKKLFVIFSLFLPIGLSLSCSNFQKTQKEKVKNIVRLSYDFSYQNINNEKLDNQFENFKENTLFHITLKNFYYNGSKKEITKEAYYLKNGQIQKNIIWPGQENKINIKEWILKMFALTPIGIDAQEKGGK